jgi:hypothetical protein
VARFFLDQLEEDEAEAAVAEAAATAFAATEGIAAERVAIVAEMAAKGAETATSASASKAVRHEMLSATAIAASEEKAVHGLILSY